MRKVFKVVARWDEGAGVYVSESDISGLHIEAENLEEFEAVLFDVASELIVRNHMSPEELRSSELKDLIPAILYQAPARARDVA